MRVRVVRVVRVRVSAVTEGLSAEGQRAEGRGAEGQRAGRRVKGVAVFRGSRVGRLRCGGGLGPACSTSRLEPAKTTSSATD
eukprot:1711326-Prymnesium_polylepis.1